MAAFASGTEWSFPADIPGGWEDPNASISNTKDTSASNAAASEAQPQHRQDTDTTSVHHIPPPASTDQPAATHPSSGKRRTRTTWPPRQCRICLEVVQPTFDVDQNSSMPAALRPAPRVTYTSEDGGRLLRPCKCKGTQKYVHEDCLNAWRLADPLQKRNYWECPTCRYRYHLQRLTWATHISSTGAQIALTIAILLGTIFVLGFIADPIINMYLDPYDTIMSAGGPTGSLIYEDEPATWGEHFVKGLASLGLLGFAKFLWTLHPFNLLRAGGFGGGHGRANTGRERMSQMGWIAILIGVATFLIAVWKAVRVWSRRTLEAAGERVMDVPGTADDDDEDD